ncbi:MAG: ribosome silencing factor [Acidimicrobiales bacterium]
MRGPQNSYVTTVVGATLRAAEEKGGQDPVVLDLRGVVDTFDALVVLSGRNDRQVRALAEEVEQQATRLGVRPLRVEGYAEGEWVAIDYGDVIVHVFDEIDREYYDLEHLWAVPAARPERTR